MGLVSVSTRLWSSFTSILEDPRNEFANTKARYSGTYGRETHGLSFFNSVEGVFYHSEPICIAWIRPDSFALLNCKCEN